MSDGTLSVRRRQPKPSEAAASSSQPFSVDSLRSGAFETFLGTDFAMIGKGQVKGKERFKPLGDIDEFKHETRRKKKLRDYDKFLKGFRYSAALDAVTRKVRCVPARTFRVISLNITIIANPTFDIFLCDTRAYLSRRFENSSSRER